MDAEIQGNMLYIVCALHCEAKPIIKFFGLKKVESALPLYEGEDLQLVISGMGKFAAASAVGYLAAKERNAAWLNIGIAGHPSLPIGTAVLAHKINDDYPGFTEKIPLPTASLLTVDQPDFGYSKEALYDMEAEGFFAAARKFSTLELIQVLKIISDNRENPSQQIDKKRVEGLIEQNLESIEKTLAMLRNTFREYAKQTVSINLQPFTNKWHFTATEKVQLSDLLRRLKALNRSFELTSCQRASDVLKNLQGALDVSSHLL